MFIIFPSPEAWKYYKNKYASFLRTPAVGASTGVDCETGAKLTLWLERNLPREHYRSESYKGRNILLLNRILILSSNFILIFDILMHKILLIFLQTICRQKLYADNSDFNNTHPSGHVFESNKSDGGRTQGAPVKDPSPRIPPIRLWTAALRTRSPNGRTAV